MSENPYQAPKSEIVESTTGTLDLVEPKKLPMGIATSWLGRSFDLFKQNWLMWIVAAVIYMFILMFAQFLPIIGAVLQVVLPPVFIGGLMIGAREAELGKPFELSYLFEGFKEHGGKLALLGVIILLMFFAAMLPIAFTAGTAVFSIILQGGDASSLGGNMGAISIGALISIVLMILVSFGYWLAPALIVFNDLSPFEAFKTSFKASIKNIMPIIVYGIILCILGVLSIFTLFLAWLVILPLVIITNYFAYKDILTAA